ncbi:MAG: hypothetical protein AAF921_04800 [Cyanobacteria bacterium P01_D01_bin.44]
MREQNLIMNRSINVVCGFLGGTILSVDGGYRVLQHPRPDRIFSRIADARWFLAIAWCDQTATPAGILTHEGQLTFQNQAALALGDAFFLPLEHRKAIFSSCLSLTSGETTLYEIQPSRRQIEILGIEIDPRYGKVAIVKFL